MIGEKFSEKFYMRITEKELKDLRKIGKKMGFKSLSSFIRFIIREETNRILHDPELFSAYKNEAHLGTLLLIP
jgi:hypothetical protein